MIGPSKLAGGGKTARPMTMAAVKRASRKRMVGSDLAKIYHKAICTTVVEDAGGDAGVQGRTPVHGMAHEEIEIFGESRPATPYGKRRAVGDVC